jgi:sodium-coupled neutral amino acid transporter 11
VLIVLLLVSTFNQKLTLHLNITYIVDHFLFINRYIGDTIPHVVRSLFPKISQVPVIWIFGDRRMCISFFTMFVSYPLSLYRDISKLAKTSALALVAIIVIIISVVIEGPQQSQEIRGSDEYMFNVINDEVFQAIAVISFGK